MKVLMVSPEAVPFAKTGGLADAAGVLPKALKRIGIDVSLVLPKYRVVDERKLNLRDTGITVKIPISDKIKKGTVLIGETDDNIPVYFIKKDNYYDRDGLYGTENGDYPDNAERFIFFSRAVIELCKTLDLRFDIIHCNDWQTALIPVYLRTLYRNDLLFSKAATVFTVHNLGYQGLFWHFDMHLTGLGWEFFTPEGIEFYGKINFMKGGLIFSDVVTTVSKAYSKEIQTEELGHGLEGVLAKRKKDLYGIMNGVDYEEWNPANDGHIAATFGPGNMKGKAICKSELQEIYSLPVKKETPLIAMISRLVSQKGFDLIEEAIDKLMTMELQLVFLGTGDKRYQKLLEDIGKRHPEKVGVRVAYDAALAHKIEAGADIFLMPSRYEPCGLNQLYSLKYGTIPVVRATGGLDDTIINFNPNTGNGNGFKFREYSAEAFLKAVKKAVSLYTDKRLWRKIVRNAMECDFSGEHSAKEYLKVYKKATNKVKSKEKQPATPL